MLSEKSREEFARILCVLFIKIIVAACDFRFGISFSFLCDFKLNTFILLKYYFLYEKIASFTI